MDKLKNIQDGKIVKNYQTSKSSNDLSHNLHNVNFSFNQTDLNNIATTVSKPILPTRNYKTIRRVAAVTCGVAFTVGTGVLISSTNSWENIQPPLEHMFNSLKSKLEDILSTVHKS